MGDPLQNKDFKPVLTMDKHVRFLPAIDKFPLSNYGKRFLPLADYVYDLSLDFGFYHQTYRNSYDCRFRASSDDPTREYTYFGDKIEGIKVGKNLFHWDDARQFAKREVYYLKYNWVDQKSFTCHKDR